EADTCASCTTHDCLRGNPSHRGCELDLFLPRKVGNLDCTFCLDCVQACPHDNIGVLAVAPATDLIHDRRRSPVGRPSERRDVTALILVLVCASFAGAALMVAPIGEWRAALTAELGIGSTKAITVLMLFVGLCGIPALLWISAPRLSRFLAGLD